MGSGHAGSLFVAFLAVVAVRINDAKAAHPFSTSLVQITVVLTRAPEVFHAGALRITRIKFVAVVAITFLRTPKIFHTGALQITHIEFVTVVVRRALSTLPFLAHLSRRAVNVLHTPGVLYTGALGSAHQIFVAVVVRRTLSALPCSAYLTLRAGIVIVAL
ncbi:unnamed protein product [Clonostachys solani]|uniref:Secreted protein n=1 Tax=Clonostachys solani TaxID=160281 RepID=A0A9N9ZFE3_9HYPO|nr:unnamed protein product [Clonostachys solani]